MGTRERWLPVTGFDGYEVSDHGRVRSLDRQIWKAASGSGRSSGYWMTRKGRVLKPGGGPTTSRPYLFVQLGAGAGRSKRIANLVLESFVGPRPKGQLVRHLNDVKTDNRLVNLAWGTYEENYADAIRNGRHGMPHLGAVNLAKTHCPKGHPLSGDNLYTRVKPDGRTERICLTCRRENGKVYDQKRYARRLAEKQAKRAASRVSPRNLGKQD